MTLDAFATAAQMEQRSQGALPADTPFLADALLAATKLIREYCGWRIADQEQETVWLDDLGGPILALPSLAVVSLDEILLDGVAIDVTTLRWLPDGRLLEPYRVPVARAVQVKMTHGFAVVPADLVDLTLHVSARALGSPLGIVREASGGVSVTYSQPGFNVAGGTVLLAHEKAQLGSYRLGWTP